MGTRDFTGQRITSTGKALRDDLVTAYAKRGPIPFTDLGGTVYSVHFDDYAEQIRSPRPHLISPTYRCSVILVEA